MKKTVSGIFLTLMLISMLVSVFNLQPVKAVLKTTKDRPTEYHTIQANLAYARDMIDEGIDLADVRRRLTPWSDQSLDGMNEWNFSNGIVIGINDMQPNAYNELVFLIDEKEGSIANTVSIEEKVVAVIAHLPCLVTSTVMTEIKNRQLSKYIEPNVRFQANFVPNDPYWPLQWGSIKIEADWAWNITMGDSSVLIAVVDTGIYYNHADLSENYVPFGYDWVHDDPDPLDDNGHGTHCAGIIAALTNNHVGIAGTAQVQVMAEKGLDAGGSGYSARLANCIIHAVDQGANIISMSWGSYFHSELIYEAIKYAYNAGVLLIASAGNEAWSLKSYPAAYDEVTAVTATDQLDNPTSFTNFGDWVELAAPGVQIYSTFLRNSYRYKSGTSMSTPYVSGVAALIWSQFPTMTRDQVRIQLRRTANDLGDPGFDEIFGYGRINARNAVEQVLPDHDLLILEYNITTYVKPRDLMGANATILNFGESNESDIEVQLLVNGDIKGSSLISVLPSGALAEISLSWEPVIEGVYNVTLYSVPVPDEKVVENNALSKSMLVRLEKVIHVPTDSPTMKQAIDVAGSGFTIYVASGLYCEHLVIYESLTLIGEQPSTTFIDGNGMDALIAFSTVNFSISGFTIQNSQWGILLWKASGGAISNNTVLDNSFGIFLEHCSNITLRNNDMIGNALNFGVVASSLQDFINHVDSSNTVDGKRIYYWVNQHDRQVPMNAGYVVIVNSTKIVVKDLNLTNNYRGVTFAYTNNSTLKNVKTPNNEIGVQLWHSNANALSGINTSKNFVGIELQYSNENLLSDSYASDCSLGGIILFKSNSNNLNTNVASDCFVGAILLLYDSNNSTLNTNVASKSIFGIGIGGSKGNAVYGNMVANNSLVGISLEVNSSNNTISHNSMMSNTRGVNLFNSGNNTIFENMMHDNFYGIEISGSGENIFYHNNIINNKIQVDSDDSENLWDDGYPSGGNYWSDYAGVDSNLDGIGDAPYVIDVSNQDNYPLLGSFTDFSATLEEKTYNVVTICNSTIIDFNYTPSTISFKVTGQEGTLGFCRITIPIVLLGKEPYEVLVDDLNIPYSLLSNDTHLFLYFTYSHSSHKIVIRGTAMLPVANFTWAPSMAKVGEPVIFDGSASMPNGGTLVGYEWNFGDGEYATGQIVTHTFSSADIYTVTLNVTDSEGLWDAEQKQIQVVQPYGPNAEFTATPETADIGESVRFDASSSLLGSNGTHIRPITEYRWDFSDGNKTTTFTPIVYHSFSSLGIYYVTLTVYAPGATPEMGSTTKKVTITAIPVGGYSFPIKGYTAEKPLTLYLVLIAILAASFTMIRRKTHKRTKRP